MLSHLSEPFGIALRLKTCHPWVGLNAISQGGDKENLFRSLLSFRTIWNCLRLAYHPRLAR